MSGTGSSRPGGIYWLSRERLFGRCWRCRLLIAQVQGTREVPENLDSVPDGMDDDDLSFDLDS
ncbi:hypothetical protein [Vreelandella rituensis]|uniref:hypothetical protein n=1 Tax=Vreelandella rituensis TaxID=2282306 RepID=UPI0011C03DF6|nr:hypothetical protein [Halomonas rituensis]